MTPSEVVVERLKGIRKSRGLTVAQVAQRCAELGATKLTEQALYNVEGGRPGKQGHRRRNVTVDEWLVLAAALEIAPVHLLLPLENEQPYEVWPGRIAPTRAARNWVRGYVPLEGTDPRRYYSEAPVDEFAAVSGGRATRLQVVERLAAAAQEEAERLRREPNQEEER